MANSNVNIANKLYAYIKHGVDISPEIKQIYNNSMIFIGDEQQIYVPVMDTYVGIGMTAYNATINRIASVEEQLRQLAENLATDLVTKIYADYSLTELSKGGMIEGGLPEGFSDDTWALNNDITIKGINDYNPETHYARRIVNGEIITLTDANGTPAQLINNGNTYVGVAPYSQEPGVETFVNASSGITITPHWGDKVRTTNPVTGQVFEKRTGNYITIDDKLTWSYMTSAYSYSLAFAQNYTASEIDRVYHNLLGESEVTYNPVSFRSFVDNVTEEFNSYTDGLTDAFVAQYNASHPDTWVVLQKQNAGTEQETVVGAYRIDRKSTYVATYTGNDILLGDKVYFETTYAQIASVLDGSGTSFTPATGTSYVLYDNKEVLGVTSNFYQLYERSEQYNSSYNMNIKDGIETLKEVAYLLDVLTDGTLGETTYLTYGEWKTNAHLVDATFTNNNGVYTYDYVENGNTTTYTKVYKGTAPNDDETYAFYTVMNPENLGIQMAYSIAGNKKDIEDLHKHAELLEKGETTLRSIQSTNSQFANVTLLGGTKHWANTDTNQGEANFNDEVEGAYTHVNHGVNENARQENSYLVGDVNIKVTLNTSLTYATVHTSDGTTNPPFTDEAGVEWHGFYTAADMDAIDTANATYYRVASGAGTEQSPYVFQEISAAAIAEAHTNDSRYQTEQYYWVPGGIYNAETNPDGLAKNSVTENAVFTKIKVKDLLALGDADDVKDTGFTKSSITEFFTWDEVNDRWSSFVDNQGSTAISKLINQVNADGIDVNDYVAFISKYDQTVIHTVNDENKLATTEWTEVYVNSKVGEIADDLENILEEAKKYTDDEIAKLDNEYIYSDFSTYWSYYVSLNVATNPNLGVEGTPEYVEAYNREYAAFVTNASNLTKVFDSSYEESNPGEVNPYRLSYITNSQYTYNIIEENGIVTAASRELPTDTLRVNAYVWGSEQSSTRIQYADIENLATQAPLLDALYAWKDANQDNQIFVMVNDDNTWEPVPTNTDLSGIDNFGNYRVKLDDGSFAAVEGEEYSIVPSIYANTNDIRWKPLYKKVPKYLELNLQDAVVGDKTNSITITKDGVVFTLTKRKSGDNVGKIVVTSSVEGYVYSDNILKHISSKPADSTKYLSVENKHFSYVDNGHGENQFEVTAHITKLEDATPTNTGFADAYDVRSFIENMFRWVDISATISADTISHRDVFFKNTNLEDVPNGATLYSRSEASNVVTFTEVNNPVYGWFWLDDNKFAGIATGDSLYTNDMPSGITVGTHIKCAVEGSETTFYLVKRFCGNSANPAVGDPFSTTYNYYINIETAKTNPLNLNETLYGAPVQG